MWNKLYAMTAILLTLTFVSGLAYGVKGNVEVQEFMRITFDKVPTFKGCKVTPFPLEAINRELKEEGNMIIFDDLEISSDGRYVQISTISDEYEPENTMHLTPTTGTIVEVATGKVVQRKNPDGSPLAKGERHHGYVYWDPIKPDYVYTQFTRKINENENIPWQVWHARYDGTDAKLVSKPEEDTTIVPLPKGTQLLVRVTKWMADGDVTYKYYLQAGDDPSKRTAITPGKGEYTNPYTPISPNEQYFISQRSGSPYDNGYSWYIHDCQKKVVYSLVNDSHFRLGMPDDITSASMTGIFSWLPDSSGLLVGVSGVKGGHVTEHQLWMLKLNGEMLHVADDMAIYAASRNGKHLLVTPADRRELYIVSAPNAPAEPKK